jgi:6-phosphogluconolactonase
VAAAAADPPGAAPAGSPGAAASFPRQIIVEDREHLGEEAGGLIAGWIAEAVAARGRAAVILAGGSTPRIMHARLAGNIRERRLPVSAITWYLGDERWVPVGDPQSNEGMARETLLGPIGAPEGAIVSWGAGTGDPVECARRYGESVRARLGPDAPDVLVLGIGADGHTASLFPGSRAFLPDGRQLPMGPGLPGTAAAIKGGNAPDWRLTLCPGVLRSARHVVFLVSGADKTGAVKRAVNGDPAAPAAWIRGGTTIFVVTRDAAGSADTGYGPEIRRA